MGNHWTILFNTLLLDSYWTYFWKHHIYRKKGTKVGSQNFCYQLWFSTRMKTDTLNLHNTTHISPSWLKTKKLMKIANKIQINMAFRATVPGALSMSDNNWQYKMDDICLVHPKNCEQVNRIILPISFVVPSPAPGHYMIATVPVKEHSII